MKRVLLSGFLMLACTVAWGLTVEEAFEAGNQAYARGENVLDEVRSKASHEKEKLKEAAEKEFERALANYGACLEQAESAALHHNMGNAYFKLGQLGWSIYHFRRAQELDPATEEVRANLAFVRTTAGLEALPSNLYMKTLARRPAGFWVWLLAMGFWSGAALLVFPRMLGARGPVFPIVGTVILLFSLVPAWAVLQAGRAETAAIVLDNDTPLLVSPTGDSAVATYLQGGEPVELSRGKAHADHFFVTTSTGEQGWVVRPNLGRVRE
jgi:tetratricopeptide (TPR) repeat protein